MQHINGRYPRYCCRRARRNKQDRGILNKSALQRKLRLHLDKVIGHQGRRGKNCTRKGRDEKKKGCKLAIFVCKRY